MDEDKIKRSKRAGNTMGFIPEEEEQEEKVYDPITGEEVDPDPVEEQDMDEALWGNNK